jgi:hypothetical protein
MESGRYVEVCDLPYYTEPDIFYERRIQENMPVKALRFYAAFLFQKPKEELTVREYKLAFLKKFPLAILIDGKAHQVTVKKDKGEWILACSCTEWIDSQKGRRCKHTERMEKILEG